MGLGLQVDPVYLDELLTLDSLVMRVLYRIPLHRGVFKVLGGLLDLLGHVHLDVLAELLLLLVLMLLCLLVRGIVFGQLIRFFPAATHKKIKTFPAQPSSLRLISIITRHVYVSRLLLVIHLLLRDIILLTRPPPLFYSLLSLSPRLLGIFSQVTETASANQTEISTIISSIARAFLTAFNSNSKNKADESNDLESQHGTSVVFSINTHRVSVTSPTERFIVDI